jgi:signal transduction histidine kinase
LLNYVLGYGYLNILHKTALGFEHLLKADYELEKIGEKDLRTFVVEYLGFAFDNVGLYQKAVDYFKKAIEFKIEAKKLDDIALLYAETVVELVPLKKFDEAKQYLEKARSFANDLNDKQTRDYFEAKSHDASGQILMGQGKYQEALVEFFKVTKMAEESQRFEEVFSKYMNSFIAQCYQKLGDWEKSILFAEKSYQQILIASESEDWLKIKTSLLLSEVYEETGQPTKAFEYLKKYRGHIKEKEEQDIANLATNLAIENFTQKNEQERAAFEKQKLIQRWWLFSISAALFSSFVFLYFLYQSNKHKQKANNLLSRQKEEINHQREKAEKTLTQLKTTQAQLVQSEKLASLGELTAGIAHEIQNPLNFVNNFAEVSAEMLVEMDAELDKGDIHEAKVISADLQQNLSKINHHGQRASAIVKGMLEHSRTNTGTKEPVDLNALADEYLRLAYHGLRARDSSFNAVMETHFDPDLPKIEVIPQDIGRVLLNLINNAFYAVNEKAKQGIEGYSPMVTVSTKKLENAIEISVKDNGKGIPDNIKDKIFQPFFTTKPTGQGTGLGLSLAYDIVMKGHGGTLEVLSTDGTSLDKREGGGTAFIIQLPIL